MRKHVATNRFGDFENRRSPKKKGRGASSGARRNRMLQAYWEFCGDLAPSVFKDFDTLWLHIQGDLTLADLDAYFPDGAFPNKDFHPEVPPSVLMDLAIARDLLSQARCSKKVRNAIYNRIFHHLTMGVPKIPGPILKRWLDRIGATRASCSPESYGWDHPDFSPMGTTQLRLKMRMAAAAKLENAIGSKCRAVEFDYTISLKCATMVERIQKRFLLEPTPSGLKSAIDSDAERRKRDRVTQLTSREIYNLCGQIFFLPVAPEKATNKIKDQLFEAYKVWSQKRSQIGVV
jgi:hypothetical protein